MKILSGTAIRVGDHVDTDAVIPARYCTSIDPAVLGSHLFEGSHLNLQPGVILVAGRNFGCGSAREHAVLALQGAGIIAVLAGSFSRTFFRNAINAALPVIELPDADLIKEGDLLELHPEEGVVINRTTGDQYTAEPYPEVVRRIMAAGGLIQFAKDKINKRVMSDE